MEPSLKEILVPTDNSENSADALKMALFFGEKGGSTIHVLHVVHTSFLTEAYRREAHLHGGDPHIPEKELVEDSRKETDAFVKKHAGRKKGIKIKVELREGEPAHEILEAVKAKGIDLVVIGTHGRTGIAHAVMGSVAERVVREATCPVLTVRHKAASTPAA